jgi:hypothetical protein
VLLQKQERLDGVLEKKELIDVWFKDQPHSVLMKWREGARLAGRALYVEGENQRAGKSMIVVRPAGIASFIKSVEKDPNGKDAEKSGRYPISQFGLKMALQRTLKSWKDAKKADNLNVEYLGVKKVEDLGGRECWVLHNRYKEPEGKDQIKEETFSFDPENWLMVGVLLKNKDNELVAGYYFRDVELNPKFPADQFSRKRITD